MKANAYEIKFYFGMLRDAFGNYNTGAMQRKAKSEITRMAVELFKGYTWVPGVGATEHAEEETSITLTVITSEQDTKKLRAAIAMLAEVIKGQLAQMEILFTISQVQQYKY